MINTQTIVREPFNAQSLRAQFPILSRTVHGSVPLVYLDNAATSQKPLAVINAIAEYYKHSNANVHRGGHAVGAEATALYEDARSVVAGFIGAQQNEIVFTKGTTEGINLVASSWATMMGSSLRGRSIVITEMEHHANIVPWQMVCERTGASLRVIRVNEDGTLDLEHAKTLIDETVSFVSIVHVSNTLGVTNDVRVLCSMARDAGAFSLVDGAQSIVHQPINVKDIGCDFFVFSGHKLYAPTGIGVLYGRADVLEKMPPYQGGGAMITSVTFEHTSYNDAPIRFEAGTPNMEGAIGLAAAIRWFSTLDRSLVCEHEHALSLRMISDLKSIDGMRLLGPGVEHAGIASFVIEGVHAQDLGILLDEQGVAIRTGHHCTMPLMRRFGVTSTARASIAAYTTDQDLDAFSTALLRTVRMLR
ncbi:MAG: SufS family cysteine desulfurase [Candidatus Kapabacteria bacterium]|nr:SufS family cysteine desulfurase [Candidatus Kapabacteria bacterium]